MVHIATATGFKIQSKSDFVQCSIVLDPGVGMFGLL